MIRLSSLALLLATAACTATAPGGQAVVNTVTLAEPAPDPAAETARLNTFLDAAFDAQTALSPQLQTFLGLKTNSDRLDENSDVARQRALDLGVDQLRRMRSSFTPARLNAGGQLSYRLFEQSVERSQEAFRWRWHAFPVTNNGSPLGRIPVFLINNHRIDNVADAEAYIARLADAERALGEIAANMRTQAERGILPPAFNFAPVRDDGRRVIDGAPFTAGADTPLFADFKTKVGALAISQAEKDRLIAAARAALTGPFRRGYETMFAALDAIEPSAQGNRGAWSLPDGAEYYAHRLRDQTTTGLTADQVHQIGLDQVARIRAEMEEIRQEVAFAGDLSAFFAFIRTDPRFRYPNSDEGRERYLAESRANIAQMMAVAPRWFHRLPRAPLEVRPVEAWRQATAPVAFYSSPSADGSRPGIYYNNLGDLSQVAVPMLEATAYHEGAPGHHFQIAFAQELEGVPKFRRFSGYAAYNEGWGLYSERLGQEMGFYRDPYSRFGMLSMQAWRAARLVVDTGIHHKRWTREQAIAYLIANTLLSERDATKEVERYFNDPGQATSYMIGQLKIFELREKARRALGTRFDIRDFHRAVLENGAVPLDVLEQLVDAYIAQARASG